VRLGLSGETLAVLSRLGAPAQPDEAASLVGHHYGLDGQRREHAVLVTRAMARDRRYAEQIDTGSLVSIAAVLAQAREREPLRVVLAELARRGALPEPDELRIAWDAALDAGHVDAGEDASLTLVEAWARCVWQYGPVRWPTCFAPMQFDLFLDAYGTPMRFDFAAGVMVDEIVAQINEAVSGITAEAQGDRITLTATEARALGLETEALAFGVETERAPFRLAQTGEAPRTPPIGRGLMRRLDRGKRR
jgi:hypothetical protein